MTKKNNNSCTLINLRSLNNCLRSVHKYIINSFNLGETQICGR